MSESSPGKREYYLHPVSSIDVFHWPEFIALMDRLGVPYELRTVGLQITLPEPNHPVVITHGYHAVDKMKGVGGINADATVPAPVPAPGDKVAVMDTTCNHNQEFRTSQPVVVPAGGRRKD